MLNNQTIKTNRRTMLELEHINNQLLRERDEAHTPDRDEVIMMENKEIEQAFELFIMAITHGWNNLSLDEEEMIQQNKDKPYFMALLEQNAPPIKHTKRDAQTVNLDDEPF